MDQTKKMRAAMPPRFIPILVKRTGRKPSYISRVIKKEIRTSPIWDTVLDLAKWWKEEQRKQQEKEEAAIN